MPKNKITATTVYIEEVLKPRKFEEDGRMYKTKDLIVEAREIFQNLSSPEKAYYTNLAKEKNLAKKKVSQQNSNIKETSNEITAAVEWKKAINLWLDQCSSVEELKDKKFFIVGTQHALNTDEGDYLALEVGVVEWSMNRGIHRTFHQFINPGPIPMGYGFQVKSHAENTHKIHFDQFEDFSDNYTSIWEEFYSFITIHGQANPIYCLKKNIAPVRGCLEWLNEKAGDSRYMTVIPIEELIIQLLSIMGVSTFQKAITTFLSDIRFEHLDETRCTLHCDVVTEHCAIGHAKILSYLTSECLGELFDFNITYQHIPTNKTGTYQVDNNSDTKIYSQKSALDIADIDSSSDEDDDDDDDQLTPNKEQSNTNDQKNQAECNKKHFEGAKKSNDDVKIKSEYHDGKLDSASCDTDLRNKNLPLDVDYRKRFDKDVNREEKPRINNKGAYNNNNSANNNSSSRADEASTSNKSGGGFGGRPRFGEKRSTTHYSELLIRDDDDDLSNFRDIKGPSMRETPYYGVGGGNANLSSNSNSDNNYYLKYNRFNIPQDRYNNVNHFNGANVGAGYNNRNVSSGSSYNNNNNYRNPNANRNNYDGYFDNFFNQSRYNARK